MNKWEQEFVLGESEKVSTKDKLISIFSHPEWAKLDQ